MAGEHCGCDGSGLIRVHNGTVGGGTVMRSHIECPGLPSRADVLREAARAVCDMCAGTTEWETARNARGYHVIIKTGSHPMYCSAHGIHALLEKEGNK